MGLLLRRREYTGVKPAPVELPFTDIKTVEEETEKAYTKTEINRMSTDDLRSLAYEKGIDNAYELSGAEIKKILIEKLGL